MRKSAVEYKYYLDGQEVDVNQEGYYSGPDGNYYNERRVLLENLKLGKQYKLKIEAHYKKSVISSKEFTFVNSDK